jgi:thioredoxin reductase (NADPH)
VSVLKTRGYQLFPVLDRSQIDTAKRFASAPEREFAPGELVYNAGERDVPTWLVLKGSISVVRRDGLNHETAITSLGPGQFSGEVSQLASAATLASASAGPEGCTALPFDAAHVRALMIGSAEVGEIMMRAFILRRVGLIEEGGVGAVLVGRPGTPELVRLQGFLGRNGYPYTVLDSSADGEARGLSERSGIAG